MYKIEGSRDFFYISTGPFQQAHVHRKIYCATCEGLEYTYI